MVLGDWEVNILNEHVFLNKPGDDKAGKQILITYDFRYIPIDYHLVRTIQFIKPISDDALLEFLADFSTTLKKVFIDPVLN